MRIFIAAITVIGLALSSSSVFAQGRGNAPVDRREKVKQKIRALRAYALTEALSLDEKTAARMFPVLAKWDDVTDKLTAQRIDVQRQLEAASGKDNKTVDTLIDDAMANQRALVDLEEKRLAELRKILTPVQTAKLLIVLPQFERRIRNQLARAIQNRGGGNPRDGRFRGRRGGGGELGGNPFDARDDDDDDDDDEAPTPRGRLPERTAPTRDTPRTPERREPCDPYSSVRGCK
jgi:hypothetical protein